MATLLERELRDRRFARLFAQEELIEDATELIARTMKQKKVSKAELARLVGTSKANITQLLSGSRNMTLRTLADLMYSMNKRILLTPAEHSSSEHSNIIRWVVTVPVQETKVRWKDTELLRGMGGDAA